MRAHLFGLLFVTLFAFSACELVDDVNIDTNNADSEYVTIGDTITITINFNDTLKAISGDVQTVTDLEVGGDDCDDISHDEVSCGCQGAGCSCSATIVRPSDAIDGFAFLEFVETDLDDFADAANVTFSTVAGYDLCYSSNSYCDRGNFSCTGGEYSDFNLAPGESMVVDIQSSESMTTFCQSENGFHLEAHVHHLSCRALTSPIEVDVEVTDEMAEGLVEFSFDFTNGGDLTGSITNSTDGSYTFIDKTPPGVSFLTVSSSNSHDDTVAVPGDTVTYNFTVTEDLSRTSQGVVFTDQTGSYFYSDCCGSSGSWTVDGWNYVLEVTVSGGDDYGSEFELTLEDRAGNEMDITETTDGSSVTIIPARYVDISTDLFDGAYTREAITFTFESDDPLFEHSDLVYNTTICQNAVFQGSFPEWTLTCDANHGYTITIDIIDSANGTGEILFDTSTFPYEIHSHENLQDYVEWCVCNSTVYYDCACSVNFPINPDFVVRSAELSATAVFEQSSSGNIVVGTHVDGHDTWSECYDSYCGGSGTRSCFSGSDVMQFIPFGNVAAVFRHEGDDDGEIYLNYVLSLDVIEMAGQCDNACVEGAICRASTTGAHCECPHWYESTNPYAGGEPCTMIECGEDDPDFRDDFDQSCEDYVTTSCNDQGHDVDGYFELLKHCPQTCGSCPDADGNRFRLFGGTTPSSGIVQVYVNGMWRAMEADGNQNDADLVCQHLGYQRGFTNDYTNPPPDHYSDWNRHMHFTDDAFHCDGEFDEFGLCFSVCKEDDDYLTEETEPDYGVFYVWCLNDCVEDEGEPYEYNHATSDLPYDQISAGTWITRTYEGPLFNSFLADSPWSDTYGITGTMTVGHPTYPLEDFDFDDYDQDWWEYCECDGECSPDWSGCANIVGHTVSLINFDNGDVFDLDFLSWSIGGDDNAEFSYIRTKKMSCL